jgi:cyanophycinase
MLHYSADFLHYNSLIFCKSINCVFFQIYLILIWRLRYFRASNFVIKSLTMIKGKLFIIGGAEDKGQKKDSRRELDSDATVDGYYDHGILKRIVDESAKGNRSRIEILTTASNVPKEIGADYKKAFALLDAKDTGILNITTREQGQDPDIMKRLKDADVVMVTGGDQMRLTSILGGTPFLDELLRKYSEEEFIYAGSSAGAAAASINMLFQGRSEEALFKGKVRITSGLGLISHAIIDTHFVKRGRIGRLFQSVVANPRLLGIGLEENTALMITRGKKMEAIGPGMTILVDGRAIADSNYNDIYEGEAISIENLTVHVMSKYDTYDLDAHKLKIDHSNGSED